MLPVKGCSDITFIPVKNGFLYLVAIMDWATRKVLTTARQCMFTYMRRVVAFQYAPLSMIVPIACRATDSFQAKRIIDNWIGFYNSE